jgi:drug/metabolite transporter (DMT)-like permease
MKATFICYFLIMIAGTAGELCVARAMKAVGEIKQFRPAAVIRIVSRAMRVGWMWLGLLFMTVAFFALLAMLSLENVSFVVPATALSYAVGALGGKMFLGERVTLTRWIGVLLVCLGVALVFIGRAA